ncbi:ABC transporter permease [Stackebrandtia nassauensis]|uniref:ABC-2 type transporter n=1 Tax=Stackebrandtia nassauensis (strain DSM 44728 / CIP 108903 / NRRL B-16338 / NBRC 102104 / LLR-40K-21) TaxID=446470 RepID=D3Q6B5_STANL|nr:ABC transporter permease [Stackebrandtia nassauensis]ADD42290.1 ABC-2 type transporter [Stackebrandtia nassauensis DSM 44728]
MSEALVARRSVGWLSILAAEVRKGLTSQLAHPLGHVISLVVGMTMYLGLQFVLGQGQLRADLLPQTLIAIGGYWFLQYSALVMVSDLVEEKNAGTFAQSQMSTAPPWLLMVGRLVTASVFGLVVAVAASAVPAAIAGIAIPWRWAALVPYALLLIGILAFTYILAAVAIRTPMVGVLQSLFTALILLLNGAFLPLSLYPEWLAAVARLLPTTMGIEAVNEVLFDGATLARLWTSGSLPLLVVHTAVLVGIGAVLFSRNHRRAVRDGSLGQY